MDRQKIGRIVAVLAGAAVLFGLEQGLGVKIYIAIPLGVLVYFAVKVAIGLAWGIDGRA